MAHRTVNSHCPVHIGQSGALSGALSGAPLKFHSGTLRSRVSAWGNPSPGPAWPHLVEGAPDSPVHTGQSGAPKSEAIFSIFCCFSSVFVLTCVYVLECHLALYVSVNMHQHYTRTFLVKLLIDNPSL
jgi:hypothetical protein